jgi:hypothetical protein
VTFFDVSQRLLELTGKRFTTAEAHLLIRAIAGDDALMALLMRLKGETNDTSGDAKDHQRGV